MGYMQSRSGMRLLVAVGVALAVVAILSQLFFSALLFQENTVSAQSPGMPRITSLTNPTTSSITVNWEEGHGVAGHWIYSVKTDGTGANFLDATTGLPPSQGNVSHSTIVTGLDDGTEYWFAVVGIGSPSQSSPSGWFSWSDWARESTRPIGRVTLGPNASAAEGGTAELTVTTTVAPETDLTINYTIGSDSDAATVDGDSDDYTGSATGSVIIAAGATSGVISVVINDDSDIDNGTRETLLVTINLPEVPTHALGARTTATVTIKEGVCDRTSEVRAGILTELSGISNCEDVTDADLSGITGSLDLSDEDIAAIKDGDFGGLSGLTELSLEENSLESLPADVFDDLSDLEELSLEDNSLETLPADVFDGLTSLEELSLEDNSLEILPADVFDGLTSLEVLLLEDNSLESLPADVFDGLASVEELSLHDNMLESLPADIFDGLTGLEILTLHDNELASLPAGIFDGLTSLQRLRLEDNPGSSFTFTAEVEQTQADEIRVAVAEGAPFDMTVTLSIQGGTLSSSSAVVSGGSTESPAVTVTPDGDGPVTVSATVATFPTSGSTVGGVVIRHDGIQTGLGASNRAPTADAGSDQEVLTGVTVTLTASGSDDDTSDTVSYSWTQTAGSTVTLSSATAAAPTFTAPASADTLTFQLTSMDGRGGSDRDTVTVRVATFTAPSNLNATAGDGKITLTWDNPSDARITGYEYRIREGTNEWGLWTSITDSGATTVEFVKSGLTNGTAHTLELRAANADGAGLAAQAGPVTPNAPPVADAGPDQEVAKSAMVTLTASGSGDPDEDALTYSWTQTEGTTVTLSSTTVASPAFTAPSSPARLTFSVTVTDTHSASDSDTVTVVVGTAPATPSNLIATPGDGQITLTWDDPSDASITRYDYRLQEGTTAWGDWTAIPGSSSSTVEYVKTTLENGTAYTMEVLAVNVVGEGTAAQAGPVTPNRLPIADAGPDQTVATGTAVTLTASGSSDPDEDTLTYSWTQTEGTTVTLSNTTAASPTFTAPSSPTTLTFEVTVTDGNGGSDSDTVSVVVGIAPATPSHLTATADDGQITLTWDDPSDASITRYEYRVREGTNDWGLWTSITGSGATTTDFVKASLTNGTAHTFELRAVNADGASLSAEAGPVTPNAPPVADAGPDQTVVRSTTVTLAASGSSDPDEDTLTYSWTQTAGMTVTLSSATAASPTFTAPSSLTRLTFSMTVTDIHSASDSDEVTITVERVLADDRELLLAIKDTLRGAGTLAWDANTDISEWDGVTIGGTPERVTELSLGSDLRGTIPAQLSNLTRLQALELDRNSLTGSIPTELGSLPELQTLNLRGNELTGSIPTELGNLTNLQTLLLSGNELTGDIPTELGNLTNLQNLDLGYNELTGSIPTWLGRMTNLQVLRLGYNQLTGSTPTELGNLNNLRTLSIPNNQLTGSIPTELGNLTNLRNLYVDNNQLTGAIPAELGNLDLLSLLLDNNQLTGAIPAELGNLTQLYQLTLDNNQLTGAIPAELGNLTGLFYLYLNNNQLTGAIPAELGNLTNVYYFYLHNNQLTGAIPAGLGNLTNVAYLWLYNNQLTGSIPPELGDIVPSGPVLLGNNQLTGCIPAAWRSDVNLLDCPPAPQSLSAGTITPSSVPLSWNFVANTTKYRVEYRLTTAETWTVDDDALTSTSHTVDGLACGIAYEFRVRAYGNGTTYGSGWGTASAIVSATTSATPCN